MPERREGEPTASGAVTGRPCRAEHKEWICARRRGPHPDQHHEAEDGTRWRQDRCSACLQPMARHIGRKCSASPAWDGHPPDALTTSVEDRLDRLEQLAGISRTPEAPAVVDNAVLFAQARNLPPALKVQLVEAMGFTPKGSAHDNDCPAPHMRGIRCNCVPPATVWSAPNDVDVHRKETWEDRLALARRWTSEQSHGRKD